MANGKKAVASVCSNTPLKSFQEKLGIVGFGVLGKGVAKAASILGMETLIAKALILITDGSLHRVGFDELLRESDGSVFMSADRRDR